MAKKETGNFIENADDIDMVDFSEDEAADINDVDLQVTSDFDINLTSNIDQMDPTDHIGIYLNQAVELRKTPLTFQDEIKLGTRIQKGLTIKNVEEPKSLKNVSLTDDAKDAFNILVSKNLLLVVSFARRLMGRGVEFADLIQYGNLRLMDAAIKYEPERGLRFSTSASWWIKQGLTRGIADFGKEIRLPVHYLDEVNRMKWTKSQLTQILGRKPTPDEISKKTGLTMEYIREMELISSEPISLEEPVNSSDDAEELGDIVGDKNSLEFLEEVENSDYSEKFRLLIADFYNRKKITKREVLIIMYRSGALDQNVHTLEEAGDLFKLTKERIRQIEEIVLRKLRNSLISAEFNSKLLCQKK